MQQIFLELIKQLNSSVFILLGVCAIIVIAIYRLGKLVQKFKHQDQKIETLTSLSEKVVEIRTKVDLIYQIVNPNAAVRAYSPISLTPTGEAMSKNIKAEVILEKYLTKLEAEVEKENPKNAYDIQLASMKIAKEKMITFLDEDELKAIKQEAYLKGMLVEDIMAIFGVLLRNRILNKKGIPISDVDLHAKKAQPG